MGNKQDALDALEDMIVTLYEKVYLLKKDDSFYSWSKTILVNGCKTMLRKRKKIVYLETREENQVESKVVNQSNPY
uniref:sigma factor n=1 Tax=Radiobacillus sp. PE A8.2 TaxID=3380349 RepID=UPI00388D76E3